MFRDATTGKRQDEPAIIHAAQKGDREAFSYLVLLYREAVINVVYRFCGDAAVAEDAAQIAFIRVWQHLPEYRHQTSFRSWLFRIAINAALDMLRKEKPSLAIDQVMLSSSERMDHALETRQTREIVEQAIIKLPEASRIVLVLREIQGMSYQEIADTLDIPVGTVMSRLNYARKQLLATLQPVKEDL
ncbi:MAG: RNA polymerase sigma factor [Anaerolineaceae bacterium]